MAPLKRSDSMHFKILLAHSWQPQQKLLNRGGEVVVLGGGVSSTHTNRERREEREGSKVYLPLQWPWKQPKMKGAICLVEQTIGSSLLLPWMGHFAQLRTQYTLLLMEHLSSLTTYTPAVKVGMEFLYTVCQNKSSINNISCSSYTCNVAPVKHN